MDRCLKRKLAKSLWFSIWMKPLWDLLSLLHQGTIWSCQSEWKIESMRCLCKWDPDAKNFLRKCQNTTSSWYLQLHYRSMQTLLWIFWIQKDCALVDFLESTVFTETEFTWRICQDLDEELKMSFWSTILQTVTDHSLKTQFPSFLGTMIWLTLSYSNLCLSWLVFPRSQTCAKSLVFATQTIKWTYNLQKTRFLSC